MVTIPEAARPLVEMQPQHDFFIGIDSDGCAFDTMEIKHKECFTPNIIKYWDLQGVSKYAREAAEFVNLYSIWRGVNRWPALIKVFDLLRVRPEVIKRHVAIPEAPHVRAFMSDKAFPQSNDGLKAYKTQYPDPELDKALAWSQGVNATIADMVYGIPPFPFVRESLQFLSTRADMLVAFRCKRRGFCPSCGARRMSQTAARLVDHVIPQVPVRQWVLSLPIPLRLLLAA